LLPVLGVLSSRTTGLSITVPVFDCKESSSFMRSSVLEGFAPRRPGMIGGGVLGMLGVRRGLEGAERALRGLDLLVDQL